MTTILVNASYLPCNAGCVRDVFQAAATFQNNFFTFMTTILVNASYLPCNAGCVRDVFHAAAKFQIDFFTFMATFHEMLAVSGMYSMQQQHFKLIFFTFMTTILVNARYLPCNAGCVRYVFHAAATFQIDFFTFMTTI